VNVNQSEARDHVLAVFAHLLATRVGMIVDALADDRAENAFALAEQLHYELIDLAARANRGIQ
jgi:hypothetical protein